tara:strand:- start:764 stop:976 length:213 start_codon:yes stop_codon:yes gene_type:complete
MSVEIVLRNTYHLKRERMPSLMREIARVMAKYGLEMELTETFACSASIKSVYMGDHFGELIAEKYDEEEE